MGQSVGPAVVQVLLVTELQSGMTSRRGDLGEAYQRPLRFSLGPHEALQFQLKKA